MTELNNTGWLISIELQVFCTLILVVLFFYSLRFISRKQFKTSRLILFVNLCYGVVIDTDIINVIYRWFPTRIDEFAYVVNIIRYVMYVCGAMFWFLYCQREFKSRLFNKWIYEVLVCLPAAITSILTILSPINGWIFTIEKNKIVEGPLFDLLPIVAYLYILSASALAFVRMLRAKDKDDKKRNIAVIVFAIPLIASDFIQIITGYPVLCIGVAVALFMVFANLILDEYYKSISRELVRKQKRDSLVNGLTEDYESVFIIDVDNDTGKLLRLTDGYDKAFDRINGKAREETFRDIENENLTDQPYFERMKAVINTYGADEDKKEVIEKFNPENVWKRLENDISFAFSYRIKNADGELVYYRAKFVRLQDKDARRFILGFRNDDAEVKAEMELEKLREEQAVKERTSELSAIIEAMTSEYIMLASLNLSSGEVDIYREIDEERAEAVFGQSVNSYDELLQRFSEEFVSEDYRRDFIREMQSDVITANLSKRKNYYVRFMLKDSYNWYEVNMSDYDDTTKKLVMGVRNIDEVVREEHQREELKRELEAARQEQIINSLTQDFDCVSYIDLNNDMKEMFCRTSPVFYNRIPAWAKQGGFPMRIKVYADIFVVPEDKEKMLSEVETDVLLSKLKERPVYFVNFRIHVDDEIRYYQIKFNANVVHGEIQSIIAGFHDVDDEMREELKRQELLEEAKELAEAGSRAKTMFLFNMSHDIRTPMNAIIGFTNMAMKNIDNRDKALDALGKTMDSSEVLLSLINQILDMSRIESGKVELAEDKADMLSFGENVRPMLQELADNKEIDFTFDIGDITDRYVYYDNVRIEEIIVNIIGNSIKYTQDGGYINASVRQLNRVESKLDVDDNIYGVYEFKVSDNGYGMSEEFQKHLFEDFAREETSVKDGIQGTGLGLPLCKKIVDLMHGTIDVESEQDIGSTFTITLPFKKREHQDVDEEVIYDDEVEEKFFGKRLLLAEDNELNREIAIDILSEDGFVVEEARDGREAVDMVQKNGDDYYDFILMDIRMPYMDGYEATKHIRGISKRHIPIIALSANAFEEDRAKSIKVGMDAHVSKPIEVDKLKKTLARFL